jgi:hypothetical protein
MVVITHNMSQYLNLYSFQGDDMMIYKETFDIFVRESPVTVMLRGMMENVFSTERLDQLFLENAVQQHEDRLLFSTVVDLMGLTVTKASPTVHAAYQKRKERVSVSVKAVYDKLNGIETQVCRALVRQTAKHLRKLVVAMKASLPALLPGYHAKILDGNHLRRTQRRLKALQQINGAPRPGQALVVLDPALMLAVDVFPCEDAHAQERSLLPQVLETVKSDDLWIADRNFCTTGFLCGIDSRNAAFIIRQHGKLPVTYTGEPQRKGRCATGVVYEQRAAVPDADGGERHYRRITVYLDKPTRDKETEIHILTNLPQRISARKIAEMYQKRWTIEAAFGEIATTLRGEVETLAYPPAALFAFCIALSMYNLLSVIKAAVRVAHKVPRETISSYYLAEEISGTYRGMMIAIPPSYWRERFDSLTIQQMATALLALAKHVCLSQYRKHPRGPKRPPLRKFSKKGRNHVSTQRVLEQFKT